jgi:GNAT superfamily N-acetyltransferase
MSSVIRPAELGDAAGIADVQTWTWREAYAGQLPDDFLAARVVTPERWQQILQEPGPGTSNWVAAVDGVVVGFASAGPDLEAEELGCLYALYLRAAWQGRGLGHRLQVAAMHSLVESGFAEATVWSLASNAPALAFYEREGWTRDGTERIEDVQGLAMPLVRLRRRLDQSPPSRT